MRISLLSLTVVLTFICHVASAAGASGPATNGVLRSLSSGLALHFPMEKPSGTTASDLSGKGRNGLLRKARWTAEGKVGGALDFSGQADASIKINMGFMRGATGLTVSAWVKSKGDPGNWENVGGTYTDKTGLGVPFRFLWMNKKGLGSELMSSVWIKGPSGRYETIDLISPRGSEYIHDKAWHHAVLTWDGDKLRLYLEGKLDCSSEAVGTSLMVRRDSIIGNSYSQKKLHENFNGVIDEFMVWTRALNEEEVRQLYDYGASGGKEAP